MPRRSRFESGAVLSRNRACANNRIESLSVSFDIQGTTLSLANLILNIVIAEIEKNINLFYKKF